MTINRFPTRKYFPDLAYVVDPRFPGGTSAAVAAELSVAKKLGNVVIHARTSRMFGETRSIVPALREVIDRLRIPLIWNAAHINADFVILHNPAFLKFDTALNARILARVLIVVTHENFLRPSGEEGFDVTSCIDRIDVTSVAVRKILAPISAFNRMTVEKWLPRYRMHRNWRILKENWFNIVDLQYRVPNKNLMDRRGRLSRPGLEKFPPLTDLDACFPSHAVANVILGADLLSEAGVVRPHWSMLPFGSVKVDEFFRMIDFFVYFTAPTWRESFGRVIAEALAAGKVVLTDCETGKAFDDAVVGCIPSEVDGVVSGFLTSPELYTAQVAKAQPVLERYTARRFQNIMTNAFTTEFAE